MRRVPLAALWVASGISLVGNQLTEIALPWLVLTTMGRPIDAGIVGAAIVLPTVLGAFAGGVIVDRIGARRTSVVADLLSAAGVVAIPVAAATIGLDLAVVAGLAFVGALLDAPGQTARQVLLPDLASRATMSLDRANAIFQSVENGAILIGPILGGLIVVALGPLGALWLDAASFIVSAAVIRALVPDIRADVDDARADPTAGIRVLAMDRVLRLLVFVAMIANFVGMPIFLVVLPTLATQSGQTAAALGLLVAAFGGGLLAGSIGYGAIAGRIRRRSALILGFVGTGLGLTACAFAPALPIVIVALALAGLASGPINPIAFTVIQERVPAATRGRVLGAVLGFVLLAAPVGMIVLGALADQRGPHTVLVISGLTLVVAGLLLALRSEMRELERPLPADPAEPQPASLDG